MFDYKFRRGERSVTGTQLFLIPSMINEFERMYSAFLTKKNNENSMENLLSWVNEKYPHVLEEHDLEDVGDLKMLEKYVSFYSLPPDSNENLILAKAREFSLL